MRPIDPHAATPAVITGGPDALSTSHKKHLDMKINRGSSFLVGLIGAGIQSSLSPHMHEAEGTRHGLRYWYRLLDFDVMALDVSALPRLLDAARITGFCGLNITHPCKQAVVPLLDELSDDAAAIGAVNTVVFKDGRSIGYNTDCTGFQRSVRETLDSAAKNNIVVLGAGGAGSAAAHGLLQLGAQHLYIHDLDGARAAALVKALTGRFGEARASLVADLGHTMRAADGVVQATPMGMAHYPGLPLPAEMLRPSQWVAEIVYFPLETELLRLAQRIGCRAVDGGRMAVYQAAAAFELFTGLTADAAAMRRDFESLVTRQAGSLSRTG